MVVKILKNFQKTEIYKIGEEEFTIKILILDHNNIFNVSDQIGYMGAVKQEICIDFEVTSNLRPQTYVYASTLEWPLHKIVFEQKIEQLKTFIKSELNVLNQNGDMFDLFLKDNGFTTRVFI